MKRFTLTIASSLLLCVLLFTGCNFNVSNPGVQNQFIACFGNIGVRVVLSAVTDDAPLTAASLLTVAPECIAAVVSAFTTPSNPTLSTPEVDIHKSPTDGVSTGSVRSNTWSNCTILPQKLQFNFYVPFEMFVGGGNDLEVFTSPPDGSSANELIAQQLFRQYGDVIARAINSERNESVILYMLPWTQITLTLPIRVSYARGEARVIDTSGDTTSLPWLFTDGYQENGDITISRSKCPLNPHLSI
jgi:hypothetical protein